MTTHRARTLNHGGNDSRTSSLALAAIIAAAGVIVVLCVRTWVDFGITRLDGTNAGALTGVGDGYFAAGFALAIALFAAALIQRPNLWAWLLPAIGATAIAVAIIAGYDAGTAWHVAGVDLQGAFVAGGHATAAVYEVLALAVAIALLAAILAGVQYQRQRGSPASSRPLKVIVKEQAMIRRILVPLDGSGLAERATPFASRIAKHREAKLLLMSAAVPGEHWAGLAAANPTDNDEREAADQYLQSVAEPLRARGLAVETLAVSGRAAPTICVAAEGAGCDLIVMTTQGRAGLDRWIVGSVADRVRHTSAKPVLLVPLDGSELAETALPFAEELAGALGASLVLEQVVVPPAALYPAEYVPAAVPILDDVEAAAKGYLTRLAGGIRRRGFAVDVRVDVGLPSQAIIEIADGEEIELIVMTTHGRTGPGRLIRGSVADTVSRHVDVPCLVVPARAIWDEDQDPGTEQQGEPRRVASPAPRARPPGSLSLLPHDIQYRQTVGSVGMTALPSVCTADA